MNRTLTFSLAIEQMPAHAQIAFLTWLRSLHPTRIFWHYDTTIFTWREL